MAIDIVPLSALLDKYPKEKVVEAFSSFSSVNSDVEYFLRDRCIQFESVGLSRTSLVYATYQGAPILVGYFAISSKPLTIKKKNWNRLSNSVKHKLMPIGYRTEMDNYAVSSILLGQLGLNFQYRDKKLITGSELLSLAYSEIKRANEVVGGLVVYVEVDNEPHLRDFYIQNGFSQLLLKKPEDSKTSKTQPYLTSNGQHLYTKKIKDL
ncbi:MAG: hypothetical protein LKF36_00065 [Lactobacillus sp.]|jgi:hypothetical protein|nr:hypothetical protein [Lactobacillus sp.]